MATTSTTAGDSGTARVILLGATTLALAIGAATWLLRSPPAPRGAPRFVGRAACVECHQAENDAWQGSHHDLAMQEATPATVVGDFGDATFTHYGVTSTFTRDGDRFIVRTEGPDGELHDYPVAYVFGFTPLQQYLIDIGQGRLQSLTIAWDSRTAAAGGQRWYHLYPNEPTPAGDELHWTGIQQNWNYMCAECHSTDLRRGYDSEQNSFHTTWEELDVSCEACHGPASHHAAWADGEGAFADLGEQPGLGLVVSFDERRGVAYVADPETGLPVRNRPRTTQKEIDTCARCHSRRTVFSEDVVPGQPLLDTHQPALLTEGLYYPDGQIQDEVYVYQSYLQSRMCQQGVTCSDCHDPHSTRMRLPGNQICTHCHDPGRYDSKAHHFHPDGSDSARCVACHAPTTIYMGVDARHDHSFRIPRPDLTTQFGVPDACTGCHDDQQPDWATAQLQQWYGRLRTDRWTHTAAFAAARTGDSDAEGELLRIARDDDLTAIVRATALFELPLPLSQGAIAQLQRAIAADDPLLRWIAARVLGESAQAMPRPPTELRPLLHDPVRGVRMAAARALLGADTSGWPAADTEALQRGLEEYEAGERCNADRPEARMNLGNLARERGRLGEAEDEYRAALLVHPQFLPAFVNLADLYRELKRDSDCEQTLRAGLAIGADNAPLQHALGLCLVRLRRLDEAVTALTAAADAAPDNGHYIFVLAVALESTQQLDQAVATLESATARLRHDRQLLELLVEYLRQQGNLDQARRRASDYAQRWPNEPAVQRWLGDLLR